MWHSRPRLCAGGQAWQESHARGRACHVTGASSTGRYASLEAIHEAVTWLVAQGKLVV